jgi:hypothetical protein
MKVDAVLTDGPARDQVHEVEGYPDTLQVLIKVELPRSRFSLYAERRRKRFAPLQVTYELLAATVIDGKPTAYYEYKDS